VAEKSGGDIRPFGRFYLTNRAISGKSNTLLVGVIAASHRRGDTDKLQYRAGD